MATTSHYISSSIISDHVVINDVITNNNDGVVEEISGMIQPLPNEQNVATEKIITSRIQIVQDGEDIPWYLVDNDIHPGITTLYSCVIISVMFIIYMVCVSTKQHWRSYINRRTDTELQTIRHTENDVNNDVTDKELPGGGRRPLVTEINMLDYINCADESN